MMRKRYKKNRNSNNVYLQRVMCVVMRLFFLCTPLLQSQTSPLPEYKIKAVFLFNFTQFVEWPDDAFNSNNDPFIIGILGTDPFGSYIDQAVAGEKVGTHPITVVRYRSVNEINNCRLLFINIADDDDLRSVLSSLNNRGVLTVSDMKGFAASGGVIGFITQNNKLRLQINISAAKAEGLNVSSKLLSVSTILK